MVKLSSWRLLNLTNQLGVLHRLLHKLALCFIKLRSPAYLQVIRQGSFEKVYSSSYNCMTVTPASANQDEGGWLHGASL